jgi:hypothetical protein
VTTEPSSADIATQIGSIGDPTIREGVRRAVFQTLLPAATEHAYPGHFTVTADGKWYGPENTWPGLDSWELAGAYLLLGRHRLVRDYFAFVRAAQRADGNIPFAIFPGETPPDPESHATYRRGERWPEDVYTYTPSGGTPRKWIGLYEHWQLQAKPLSVLGAVSYVLTASDLFAVTGDVAWVRDNLPSVEAAARYVRSKRDHKGLLAASGFYVESPPRNGWDGVTQCYGVKAFRELAALLRAAGQAEHAPAWEQEASDLAAAFRRDFWCGDHFAEYVHHERGLIDTHGLSDVNWAAIAWDVATAEQGRAVWPLLMAESGFWSGGMPTQLVTKPDTYEEWELPEPLPWVLPNPKHDVAAMGRVWWLEAQACLRMRAHDRLRESVRLVCENGLRHDGWWFERYPAQPDGTVKPSGANGYCEYAAILVRVVLGNLDLFTRGT